MALNAQNADMKSTVPGTGFLTDSAKAAIMLNRLVRAAFFPPLQVSGIESVFNRILSCHP